MKVRTWKHRALWLLPAVLLALCLLSGCGGKAAAPSEPSAPETQDYRGKRVGVMTGSIQDAQVAGRFPDAERLFFSSMPDMLSALRANKIDAFACPEALVRYMMTEAPDIDYRREWLGEGVQIGAVFPKTEAGQALCAQFNAFIREALRSGVYEEIQDTWFGADESKRAVPELYALPGPNGVLRMAADTSVAPFIYIKDGAPVGIDIDMVVRFCREYGYGLEVVPMDFSGVLASVSSGKAEFACCGIAYTPERAESVLFSEPYYESKTVMAVLKGAGDALTGTGAQMTAADLARATIGVQTGTTHDALVRAQFPDAKILYYNTYADLLVALNEGKIDAFPSSELTLRPMLAQYPRLQTVEGLALMSADLGFVAAKTAEGRALCDEISAWFAEARASGEMEDILRKWTEGPDSERTVLDWTALPAKKGTLRMATEGGFPPYEYYLDGALVGIEIDMAARFSASRGYALAITDMSFESVLPSVSMGKSDFAASGIAITPVRAESLSFTEPYYTEKVLMVTLPREGAAAEASFWQRVAESFEKTFIRENRWKLFVQGIGTTLLITVMSILLGTALGFGVYLLCRNGNVVANGLTRFFVWLVHGMPMVVLLMILYYIIFGKVAISGTVVSIIGFTLVFGASVYGMLRSGVGAVDVGQTEAAWALGYTDRRAFFRVVLPQALPHFFPAYKGEITATIKATAIVGYVAVQDLTKMGDIVRSRTYEAFFPLIAVAIIYFILAGILTAIVNRLGVFIDPRRRKKEDILKGLTAE